MLDTDAIKSRAKELKLPLSELAAKIGYSEAGFHKALNNGTMNITAVMNISKELGMPLEKFIVHDETLKLATVLSDRKNIGHEEKFGELAKLIEQEREYLKITVTGLLEQIHEKDKQLEKMLNSCNQKDQVIADYLGMLRIMADMQLPAIKNIMLSRKPVEYSSQE